MPRSSYIYVPYSEDRPLGFFTVKHEMMTFLKSYYYYDEVKIHRYHDGGGAEYTVLEEDFRE